ncbi:MAG: ABC transporter permease, partial [Mycobacteriales bacterium]
DSLGPAAAGPRLSGPLGLAWRQQRDTMITWTVGIGLYGVLIAGATKGVDGFVGNGHTIRDAYTRIGGHRH